MEVTPTEPETPAEPRIWRSCCFDCDKEVAQFITKTLFAGAILAFACIQIATSAEPAADPLMSWYTSMIGLVAGSYIEQSSSTTRVKKE